MKEEFEKLVAAGKLNRQQIDPLTHLVEDGFCFHRSWGFGKITTVYPVFGRLTIDFQTKPGHAMDMAFAADMLKPIPKSHIYARKVSDIAVLREMAGLNHVDLIKLVLKKLSIDRNVIVAYSRSEAFKWPDIDSTFQRGCKRVVWNPRDDAAEYLRVKRSLRQNRISS